MHCDAVSESDQPSWQQGSFAFWILSVLAIVAVVVNAVLFGVAVRMGDMSQAAYSLLHGHLAAALSLCMLAAISRRRRLLSVGVPAWALAFYLSSIWMPEGLEGDGAGMAMRVAALATVAFALAAWRIFPCFKEDA